ncbi:sensor histidine kinase [Streptacidiphilus cavernicola]|uniref:histidine kinase n=1 Tax=Streptacidiphilus cavernicola TaxID=3342716 RepID=A0ABV6W672_9ACTN
MSDASAGPAHWYQRPWVLLTAPVLPAVLDALLADDLGSPPQLSASLLAAAALLFRRRWPVPVLLLTLPGLQVGYIWLAPMLALYTVAATERRRPVLATGAVLVALAQFLPWPYDGVAWDRTTALAAMYSLMTAAAPVALGLLVQTRHELAFRLDELTRGQHRERQLLEQSVLSTERARLAREMHDVVAHQVSLISIQAAVLQVRSDDPKAAAESARTIRQLSVRTLEELRQLVGVLRAAGGDGQGPTPQPTLADLPGLITGSGLDAVLDTEFGTRRHWPEPVERAAYRTVQEALTNIRKHAPGSTVAVRLRSGGGRLHVEVRNGPAAPGAEPLLLPSGGHGLIGLRERAQQLGGTLETRRTEDGGYLVSASLPLIPTQTARE